ncbi:MAG: glycoside hydrolase family 2 TIM barrel-domain containing protein, partial [Draconibacterium sp.]|nr:glycoside hydrolase family 2 TIM barrel-domain containing protein [Draconibacterium sp.]
MKSILSIFLIITFLISCTQNQSLYKIDLTGTWQFQMDPNDVGASEKWFNKTFSDTVQLPGSMVENGKGYDITLETEWTGGVRNTEWYKHPSYKPYHDSTNIKFPYWLQPNKKYTGAAWYSKKVTIPKNWEGKTVWLNLERPHWETVVWVNGIEIGKQNSLATPHRFDISNFLIIGENTIAVRIDNRTKEVDVGWNSHSISDHTQSNWNGIVGEISIESKDAIYFEDVRIFPDILTKSVKVKAVVQNTKLKEQKIEIEAEAEHKKTEVETPEKFFDFTLAPGENIVTLTYPLGDDALLWDEFNPNVYELLLEMRYKNGEDVKRVDFGLREFKVEDGAIKINGRQVFLRGTLECAIFPKTGYPPTDVEGWKKVYAAIQAHGLNHIRFHSWCPPKAAFEAADEMGVYLHPECSSWANQSTRLGSGLPIDQYIWDESERIVKEYGNHPSFVMMAYGNEPGGPKHIDYLQKFVNYWKEKDNRRIYTAGAGWPVIDENEFHC